MIDQNKPKDELLLELHELRQKYDALEELYASSISESEQAEKLINQTRQNYESFFNTINEFLFVLDLQGNIIHTNSTVIERLGYTAEELSGISVLMIHPAERREEAGRIVGEMLNGSTEFCPVPLITKSGMQIPVVTRVSKGVWNGQPVIFGVTKDISQLRLSEEKFSKVFYLNPSACGLSDMESHRYVEVNEAFYKLLEFDREEVIGKTASELGIIPHETVEMIMRNADQFGHISNAEARLKTKNGKMKHVLLSAENIYIQDKKYRFTVVHDITERKLAEKEVERQAGLINSLIDSVPDLIFFKDLEGVFLGCNPSFCEVVGLKKEEIFGKTDYDFVSKENADIFRAHDKNCMEAGHPLHFEEWITYPDGLQLLVDTMKTPFRDADGSIIGMIGISRDITERKKSEELTKLRNEELLKFNAEKDKFFSLIAHDLRGPLGSFIGLTQYISEELSTLTPEQTLEIANSMNHSAVHLYRLLENLLEWAKIQLGRTPFTPRNIELQFVIDDCLASVVDSSRKKEIEILRDFPADFEVFADANVLQIIIRNLVSNAVKYTPKGGKIWITARKTSDSSTEISVRDSGIGMNREMIDLLFKLDSQINRRGTENEPTTGMGLFICKDFIEKHNGKICVQSIPDVGSTFTVILPEMP